MTALTIMVVSGGVGTSGTQILRTALAQFPTNGTAIRVVSQVRTVADIGKVIAEAVELDALIVHTLVDDVLRRELMSQARHCGIVEVDLLGQLLAEVGERLGYAPLGKPGLYRKMREEDLRRIEAIEFAVDHDDGKRASELGQAEIVLTGVSRVGKTPLSMYLSTMGWKVGNVPLVRGLEPPGSLFEIDRRRVIGLTIEAGQLVAHRRRRGEHMGLQQNAAYTAPVELLDELEFAQSIFRRGHFATVDTTDKPIEESADEVIARVRRALNQAAS